MAPVANYYNNELFSNRGFKLLRGFDEESIYTPCYAVGNGRNIDT